MELSSLERCALNLSRAVVKHYEEKVLQADKKKNLGEMVKYEWLLDDSEKILLSRALGTLNTYLSEKEGYSQREFGRSHYGDSTISKSELEHYAKTVCSLINQEEERRNQYAVERYRYLNNKGLKGIILTESEKDQLNWICDYLAADH